MQLADIYQKALNFEFLSIEEGMFLFEQAPLTELMHVADEMRKKQVPHQKVTWQIDRNVNTTNVCVANCKFCNFYRIPGHAEAYITDMPTYRKKIEEVLHPSDPWKAFCADDGCRYGLQDLYVVKSDWFTVKPKKKKNRYLWQQMITHL